MITLLERQPVDISAVATRFISLDFLVIHNSGIDFLDVPFHLSFQARIYMCLKHSSNNSVSMSDNWHKIKKENIGKKGNQISLFN